VIKAAVRSVNSQAKWSFYRAANGILAKVDRLAY